MDGHEFDAWTRRFATATSRRAVLRGLIGGGAAALASRSSTTLGAKADICHRTGNGSFELINVNTAALPDHEAHGDGYLGTDAHCSACGNACVAGQSCCAGSCVDLLSDPGNCGGCGTVCESGSCLDGGCGCADGLTDCAGACVDTTSDPNHCGACGAFCATGECFDSQCYCGEVPCGGCELGVCDGACVDTTSDPNHCGGCRIVCESGECSARGAIAGRSRAAVRTGRSVTVHASTRHQIR